MHYDELIMYDLKSNMCILKTNKYFKVFHKYFI